MGKKFVLIAGMNLHIAETMGELLENRGYEVRMVCSGVDIEQCIRTRAPDLLVLSEIMPRKNGFELCAELKKNKSTKNIPVILVGEAVGGRTCFHFAGRATEADDFIVGPAETRSLLEAVERLAT